MNDLIFGGRHRDGEVQMAKFNGIRDDLALGVGLDSLEAAVEIKGRTNIEAWLCVEIPRLPSSLLCMDEDSITNQTKWCLVEVEGPLEKFICTNPWIKLGLTEKIEGEFSLWQKRVPKELWKGRVDVSKNGQEVVLECANSAFSPVLVMHVR
jgi:hypothetical protein